LTLLIEEKITMKKKKVHQRHVKQTRRRREKWKAPISRVMAT